MWRHPVIRAETASDPAPGPQDVLVRVKSCGVCGSDRRMVQVDAEGYMTYPGNTRLPVIAGHEFAGEIVEVGGEVKGFRGGAAGTPTR